MYWYFHKSMHKYSLWDKNFHWSLPCKALYNYVLLASLKLKDGNNYINTHHGQIKCFKCFGIFCFLRIEWSGQLVINTTFILIQCPN